MASLAQPLLPDARVFALDTCAGVPATDRTVDAHRPGDFPTEPLADLLGLKGRLGLENLEVVRKAFEETAAGIMSQAGSVRLAHIDCDIRDAVEFACRATRTSMVPRGYVVFGDPITSTCIGAIEAVEERLIQEDSLHIGQAFPPVVFRQPA